MAGASSKKRSFEDKAAPPPKKQKRQSKSRGESNKKEEDDFKAVDLLASDSDDIHNAIADDGADSDSDAFTSDDDAASPPPQKRPSKAGQSKHNKTTAEADDGSEAEADDNASSGEEEAEEEAEEEKEEEAEGGGYSAEEDEDDEFSVSDTDTINGAGRPNTKSKRNDPSAFSTSMSKILSTKLPTSRRADPVLSRSAAAHHAARASADSALEQKARRLLRLQKKEAQEKGRVRDVLVATNKDVMMGGPSTTGEVLGAEKRLRKVAQRGVVKLFNAVRAAQVKAAEAEKAARKQGVVGVTRKEAKVNEMSKKGFLDLIASGGGLKQGPIEEA
ncbi:Rrp15p-domain-containing protein [Sodiomyces alkalinus F11]|uniref:Rrp15p-domain-containing protein n=1 Tax=Sodiomyces alkalinus (strain CBS 110278 / VKM F-3762 / F11) TaxID=1314773 RepID=A0A3N2PX13_SODAK|nr:Rrp15p-domain-containing protein [Sodiomyces alkalinus F11]ROT39061.1 Rrp15p-domain-containing protein [Sodiomyces alkalinus F11]